MFLFLFSSLGTVLLFSTSDGPWLRSGSSIRTVVSTSSVFNKAFVQIHSHSFTVHFFFEKYVYLYNTYKCIRIVVRVYLGTCRPRLCTFSMTSPTKLEYECEVKSESIELTLGTGEGRKKTFFVLSLSSLLLVWEKA